MGYPFRLYKYTLRRNDGLMEVLAKWPRLGPDRCRLNRFPIELWSSWWWDWKADVQRPSVCLLADGWTQGAGRESRVEASHQPEKCPNSRTTFGSKILGDSAAQHKEKGSLSVAGSRCRQAEDWAHWHVHFAGSYRKVPWTIADLAPLPGTPRRRLENCKYLTRNWVRCLEV